MIGLLLVCTIKPGERPPSDEIATIVKDAQGQTLFEIKSQILQRLLEGNLISTEDDKLIDQNLTMLLEKSTPRWAQTGCIAIFSIHGCASQALAGDDH
jgi:hypothetical protein